MWTDLTGQKFGKLTVIGRSENKIYKNGRSKIMYSTICECGTSKLVNGESLKSGRTKTCGCLSAEIHSKRLKQFPIGLGKYRTGPSEGGFNQLYSNYKRGAKIMGRVFELTKEEFAKLTKQNCHYCGTIPTTVSKLYGRNTSSDAANHFKYTYNGVDRKDNDLGYTTDNSVTCCKTCNFMKKGMPYSKFINWINDIIKFRDINKNES